MEIPVRQEYSARPWKIGSSVTSTVLTFDIGGHIVEVFKMAYASIRCLAMAGCVSAVIHAAPFTLNITSTNSPIGTLPSGPLAGSTLVPLPIDLTPNVPATFGFAPYSGFFYPGGGPPHTGATTTVVQTVTVNGVSVNVTRTVTLAPLTPTPGHDCANFLSAPAVTVTVDLGASGKVDVTLPQVSNQGEDCNNNTVLLRGIIIVPPFGGNPILLHDVPAQPPPTPLPPTLILSLTGLAGLGLYQAWRKIGRPRLARHALPDQRV
jgi:hypothetical protein